MIPPSIRPARFLLGLALATLLSSAHAQQPAEPKAAEEEKEAASKLQRQKIENWGIALDLAGDCHFAASGGKLTITVPGSEKPHDLSTELHSSTAPRVLQPALGDFTLQVRIDGEFAPGDESTQAGRTGYTGAGLVVFADAKNFVRLERATLHRTGGKQTAYTNFEVRVDGDLERIGLTSDAPLEEGKPTWLRLQRKGNFLHGAVSQDGVTWKESLPKELTDKAWKKETLAGVAAISTSTKTFEPTYSEFSIQSKPAEAKPEDPQKLEK